MPNQGLFRFNDGSKSYYVFGGHSDRIETMKQSYTFENTKPDTFIMKYLLDKDLSYQCLIEYALDSNSLSNKVTRLDNIKSTFYKFDETVTFFTEQRQYFATYTSPYSGAFDLLDTLTVPRVCAANNVNMTQLDYFYGTKAATYDLTTYNYEAYTKMMDDEWEFVFQNGTKTTLFATLDMHGNKITVQTNDENLVGT